MVFFGKYIALIFPSFINVCHCPLNKLTDTFSHYGSTYIFLRISFKGTGNRKDPRYIRIRGINDGVISGEQCICIYFKWMMFHQEEYKLQIQKSTNQKLGKTTTIWNILSQRVQVMVWYTYYYFWWMISLHCQSVLVPGMRPSFHLEIPSQCWSDCTSQCVILAVGRCSSSGKTNCVLAGLF